MDEIKKDMSKESKKEKFDKNLAHEKEYKISTELYEIRDLLERKQKQLLRKEKRLLTK